MYKFFYFIILFTFSVSALPKKKNTFFFGRSSYKKKAQAIKNFIYHYNKADDIEKEMSKLWVYSTIELSKNPGFLEDIESLPEAKFIKSHLGDTVTYKFQHDILLPMIIYMGDIRTLEFYIETYSFDFNKVHSKKYYGKTFFEWTLKWKRFEILDWLFEKKTELRAELNQFLNKKINTLSLTDIKWFIDQETEITTKHIKDLTLSFRFEVADFLINNYFSDSFGVFRNKESNDLFDFMIEKKNIKGVKWLIDKGFKPTVAHLKDSLLNFNFEISDLISEANSQKVFNELSHKDLIDLFVFFMEENKLDGMKWLVKKGFKLKMEHIEKMILENQWGIIDWMTEWVFENKIDSFVNAVESDKLFSSMLKVNHLNGMKWVYDFHPTEITAQHIRTALSNQQLSIVGWLIEKNPQALEQKILVEFFDKALVDNKPVETLGWFVDKGVQVTAQHIRMALSNQQLSIVGWLIEKTPQALEQKILVEFFDKALVDNKPVETLGWFVDKGVQVTAQHIRTALSNQQLSIVGWLVEKNPQALEQKILVEFFDKALVDNKPVETLGWFVDKGIQVTAQHIRTALSNQQLATAGWLVEKNPQALDESSKEKIIYEAIKSKDLELVEWLYKNNFYIPTEQLILDVMDISDERIFNLIDEQRKKYEKNQALQKEQNSPIREVMESIEKGVSIERLKSILKDQDIDLNKEFKGHSFLSKVIIGQNREQIDLVLEYAKKHADRININKVTNGGMSALKWSVYYKDLETVKELGLLGVEIGGSNQRGQDVFNIVTQIKDTELKVEMIKALNNIACQKSF